MAEQLRGRFAAKSCRVDGTPGDWFALDEKDCATLIADFGFTTVPALASNGLMVFQPENFRSFDDQTPSSLDIRTEDGSPLILIKGTGEVAWARTRLEKDQLISRFNGQHDWVSIELTSSDLRKPIWMHIIPVKLSPQSTGLENPPVVLARYPLSLRVLTAVSQPSTSL